MRAQCSESGKRMDVVVDDGGAGIVLEAEAGFNAARRKEAISDTDRRLKQGLTTTAIACYSAGATKEA